MLVNFDFDGVLVDSLSQLHRIAVEAAKNVGTQRQPTLDDFRTIQNLTFGALGAALGLSPTMAEAFANDMFAQLRTAARAPQLFQGIPEVLRDLARRYKVVIITANVRSMVENVLRNAGILSAVGQIFDGEQEGSKAAKIRKAIEIYECVPKETFMVGDTMGDILAGRQAGVRTIAVTWGYQPEALLRKGHPDYFARSPNDLLSILR